MKPQNTPPKKGIIVCDTSALLPLMAPLPLEALTKESYQQNPLPTVFDGLVFLAKHGYDVVIPEMIANEMGNHLRDGECLGKYFPNTEKTSFDKALAHRAFFRDVARMQKDGISIRIQPPLPEDTSPEAKFLNTAYYIHTLPISDFKKRGEFLQIALPKKGGAVGDKQIQAYVESLPPSETPIYILSNKVALQHSFPARSDVNGLGSYAFYKALKREGFLKDIGINPDMLDFSQHVHEYYAAYKIDSGHNGSAHTDATCSYDATMPTEPFAAGMHGLAEELKAQKLAVAEVSETPTLTVQAGGEVNKPMPSQMDKWAKWAKK